MIMKLWIFEPEVCVNAVIVVQAGKMYIVFDFEVMGKFLQECLHQLVRTVSNASRRIYGKCNVDWDWAVWKKRRATNENIVQNHLKMALLNVF